MGGNRLSDADFAVYLRNIALALAKEAQERNISIRISTDNEGNYASAEFGDYEYTRVNDADEYFQFAPFAGTYKGAEWSYVTPDQIQIGGLPEGRGYD